VRFSKPIDSQKYREMWQGMTRYLEFLCSTGAMTGDNKSYRSYGAYLRYIYSFLPVQALKV